MKWENAHRFNLSIENVIQQSNNNNPNGRPSKCYQRKKGKTKHILNPKWSGFYTSFPIDNSKRICK